MKTLKENLYTKEPSIYSHRDNNTINIKNTATIIFSKLIIKYYTEYLNNDNLDHTLLYNFIENKLEIFENTINLKNENFSSNVYSEGLFLHNISKDINEDKIKKLYKKINSNIQTQIYKKIISDRYIDYNENILINLSFYLSTTNQLDTLDILNIDENNKIWTELTFYTHNKKSKEEKHIAYFILEQTNGKAINWFIKEENLTAFSNLRFKNKNFISYFKNEPWLVDTIIEISKDKKAFTKIILENKPSMNVLNSFIKNEKNKRWKNNKNYI